MNQAIEYTLKDNEIINDISFGKKVSEATRDIQTLKEKISIKEKENFTLANKLEKLIELKYGLDEKKVKKKNNKFQFS